MKEMKLLFPQRQGSGKNKDLLEGALFIRDRWLANEKVTQVEIRIDSPLEVENDILGYTQILQQLKEAARVISEAKPGAIFTIGGDCGIEVAPVSYLNQIYDGDLAVVWLDAHGDLNIPSTSPSKLFHGMPLRALLGQGDEEILKQCFSTLSVDQVILAGVRDLDEPEESYIQQSSMRVWTVKQLEESSSELIEWINMRGFRHVYIHVDLDVLDPGHFPSTMCPTPNGLGVHALMNIVEELQRNFQVVGYSVTEFAPKGQDEIDTLHKLIEYGCSIHTETEQKT